MSEIEHQSLCQLWKAQLGAVLVVFAMALLTLGSIEEVQGELDQIYVVINDEVVTRTEVDRSVRDAIYQIRSRGEVVPKLELLESEVVEGLVEQRLQHQRAQELGINVPIDQVLVTIKGIAEKNGFSMIELRQEVRKTGRSYDEYQEELRQQLIVKKLVEQEVTQKIDISEEEISNYLDSHKPVAQDISYNLSHVVIKSQGDRVSAQVVADQIYERIVAGASFDIVISETLHQLSTINSADLGWRSSDQLPDLFITSVKELDVGTVTRPIESQNGFHILRLNGKRGNNMYVIDQVRLSHILMIANEFRGEEATEEKLLSLRERIKSGAQFNEIARLYSEDLDSRALGGDLGWIDLDGLPSELALAVKHSEVGQVSMPVKTSRGYHIIQILNRRSEDISAQMRRKEAEQEIRLSKFNNSYKLWLDELRNAAWIDYKLSNKI